MSDTTETISEIKDAGLYDELRRLYQPRVLWSLAHTLGAWAAVIGAWLSVCWISYDLLPITGLIAGRAQYSLSALWHDASHGNMARSGRLNNGLAYVFLSAPLLAVPQTYRSSHAKHHKFLGIDGYDPDFLSQNTRSAGRTAARKLIQQLCDYETIRHSLIGSLGRCGWKETLPIMTWWAVVLAALYVSSGPGFTFVFLTLWIIGKLTSYHFLVSFRELTEHCGLTPGSIYGYCRNAPDRNVLKWIFQADNDGYHLIHHLFPRVPLANLREAQSILLRSRRYRENEIRPKTYFGGTNSVWQSLDNSGIHSTPRARAL